MSKARSPRLVCSTTIGTSRLSCKSIGSRSRIISRSLRKKGALRIILFQLLGELLGADLALGDLRRIEDVVYDLVFVKWRPQAGQRIGVVLKEVDHLALLAGVAPGLVHRRPRQLVLLHLDLAPAADLGEQQA